jgi:hypothetical protein
MPVTPSDSTPAELLALQALLDRSTRTATPAVADSVAYPARQMSAAEFVEFWRSVRLVAMATVGPAGQPHVAPVHAELAGRRSDSASTRTPSVGRTSLPTPASPSPPGGLTARSRSSTAARARSQAACALRGRDRAAGPAAPSRSRFKSRASTRCARRSASRAYPPRRGSDSATPPWSPTSATSSELGAALAPRPVAARYRCFSLALPPSRKPSSRFEPASVPGWRRIQVSRPRSSPDRRPCKAPNLKPRRHGARGSSHAFSARRSGSRRPACGHRGLA